MDKLLKQVYRELNSPVGVMTVVVSKDWGYLKKGDLRGCTISSFHMIEDGFCFFSYNKARVMASALNSKFVFHYLSSDQIDLANRFSTHGLSCFEQFKDVFVDVKDDFPIIKNVHSIILAEVVEKIDIGNSYFYKGKINHAEIKSMNPIMHYSKNKYN